MHENQTAFNLRQPLVRYRNRDIHKEDVTFISNIINEYPNSSRIKLAKIICEAWNWRLIGGKLKISACCDLLVQLDEWGFIKLPVRKIKHHRKTFPILPVEDIPLAWAPLEDPYADLNTLAVRPISKEEQYGWRIFIERFHYLGCGKIVGEKLLYAAFLHGELVALIGWASAAFRSPLREHYIGWDEETKRKNLPFVVNNVRYLVLPWVRVRCLASKVLAMNLRRLKDDWQERWSHPVYLAETYIDTCRFKGTSYKAANWQYLGHSAGRKKQANAYLYGSTPKAIYVYPLCRHAILHLRGEVR
jgi:hypothetical protein